MPYQPRKSSIFSFSQVLSLEGWIISAPPWGILPFSKSTASSWLRMRSCVYSHSNSEKTAGLVFLVRLLTFGLFHQLLAQKTARQASTRKCISRQFSLEGKLSEFSGFEDLIHRPISCNSMRFIWKIHNKACFEVSSRSFLFLRLALDEDILKFIITLITWLSQEFGL